MPRTEYNQPKLLPGEIDRPDIGIEAERILGLLLKADPMMNATNRRRYNDHAIRAIEDVIRDGDFIPTPEKIIRETAKYYNIKEEELTGQSRSKNTVMARQVSMHLMRTLTNLPLTAIGEHHGSRNHATVLSSIRKVEELLKSDPNMAGVIRDITSNITTKTGSM